MASISVFDLYGSFENDSFKPIKPCCYKIQADVLV